VKRQSNKNLRNAEPKHKRRVRWWHIVVGAFVVAGGGLGVAYSQLRPFYHFRTNHLPVVAVPTTSKDGQDPAGSGAGNQTGPANNSQSSGQSANQSNSQNGNGNGNGKQNSSQNTKQTTNQPSNQTGLAVAALPEAPGTFNVLLLGVDARAAGQASRSDSIIVVHVNLKSHQYNAISIPRDSRVDLPGYGWTKITHANFMAELNGGSLTSGARAAIQAVSNLTGLTINYYAETDVMGLTGMVNALGGIEMNVPFPVTLTHPWYGKEGGDTIPAGMHFLTGETVSNVTHERYSLPNGDFGRQQLQEEALIGIAKGVTKPRNLPKLPSLIRSLSRFVVTTNMSSVDMLSLAMGAGHFHSDELHYYQVPGQSAYERDPILGQDEYYWIPDMAALRKIIRSDFED